MDDLTAARQLYDTVADSYVRRLPDASFEAGEDLAIIGRFAALIPSDARVLDAGCGTGRMQPVLRSLLPAHRAVGVDLSDEMLRHARLAYPQARFDRGELAALPYPDASFDAVFAWYSIIHTAPADLAEVFAELRRVLADGGAALFGFQHGSGERRRSEAYGHAVELRAHLHSVDDVSSELERVGFVSIESVVRPARPGEAQDQGFVLVRAV
ncbi:class I SAM-dependent methyltransferase [Microbacterium gorillae]|uniref:class I SAM-dependent methyltransferase n=1 Tax=Microbacterium gorillae TaxID=1231063 RepID=UPI003D975ECA